MWLLEKLTKQAAEFHSAPKRPLNDCATCRWSSGVREFERAVRNAASADNGTTTDSGTPNPLPAQLKQFDFVHAAHAAPYVTRDVTLQEHAAATFPRQPLKLTPATLPPQGASSHVHINKEEL